MLSSYVKGSFTDIQLLVGSCILQHFDYTFPYDHQAFSLEVRC